MCYFEWYTWRFIKLAVQLYPGRKTLPFWKLFLTNFKTICDLSCENVRSLQFDVFAWIAICIRCISCLNRLSIRSNSSGCLCEKKIGIRSNSPGYPCKENLHRFKWLMLSVQKNLSSFGTAWAVCSKKLSPVWKKLLTVRATGAICSKINFSRVSISQDNFVASHSRRTRYSWVVTLRSLFTNALWIVAYLFLLL